MRRLALAFAVVLMPAFAVGLTFAGDAQAKDYSLSKTLKIGGDGGWDYATVNAEGTLLYLPRTTHTQVIEIATGKVVGDIQGNNGSHGVALVPELGRGFITNGKDASVQIFDLKTNETLGKISAAEDADGIIYDPASKHVLVMCGDAGVLVPIAANVDAKTGKADAAIALGGKPEFAVVDGAGKAFVNLVDKKQVAVVDTKAMKVEAHWSTSPGEKPVGMSMDPATRRLFVGCRSQKLIVMSATDGKILADLPIGAGVDATAFDAGAALASCADGTLTIIRETSPGKYEVTQTVKTAPRAKTMAVDAKTGTIYLPTADLVGKGPKPKPVPGTFKVLVVTRG